MSSDGHFEKLGHEQRHSEIEFWDRVLEDARVRWGCAPGDAQTNVSLQGLRKKWVKWDPQVRWAFLNAVEQLAEAQRRKHKRVRRAEAARYKAVRSDGVGALKLCASLISRFNIRPWNPKLIEGVELHHVQGANPADVVSGALTVTIGTLASLAVGTFYATGLPGKIATDASAAAALHVLKQKAAIPWNLLADIVSLAVGTRVTPDSIRRLQKPGSLKSAGFSRWRSENNLIEQIFPYADQNLAQAWLTVARAYLLTP